MPSLIPPGRPCSGVAIGLALLASTPAMARRGAGAKPEVARVPSIEEVVEREGFTPKPSQSEIYEPGTVLVPNERSGHDKVYGRCVSAEPDVAYMSQSSIATSLSAGVFARLTAARGSVAAGVEKRLSFVDPEQRTIELARMVPTSECIAGLRTAAVYRSLDNAVVVHDGLVAQVQNTICTRADAEGRIAVLGEAEAAAYSECVQESKLPVPLGFKAVPLASMLQVVGVSLTESGSGTAVSSASFSTTPQLDVRAQLDRQKCAAEAQDKASAARAAQLDSAAQAARRDAQAAWAALQPELEACVALERSERRPCVDAVDGWLGQARSLVVSLPAAHEAVPTACGVVQAALEPARQTVAVPEVTTAEALRGRLVTHDAPVSKPAPVSSPAPAPAAPKSKLTRDDIQKEIRRSFSDFKNCYDTALRSSPMLEGRVKLKFQVAPSGTVQHVTVDSTWNNAAADRCMVRVAERMSFPSFQGGPMPILYPFTFRPSGG